LPVTLVVLLTKKLKDEPDGEVGLSSSPQLAPMTRASRNIVRLIASPRWKVNDCSRTNGAVSSSMREGNDERCQPRGNANLRKSDDDGGEQLAQRL
jgi:hypothetical protein